MQTICTEDKARYLASSEEVQKAFVVRQYYQAKGTHLQSTQDVFNQTQFKNRLLVVTSARILTYSQAEIEEKLGTDYIKSRQNY